MYQILTARPPHGPKPIDHDLFHCGVAATSAIKLLSSVPPQVTDKKRGQTLDKRELSGKYNTCTPSLSRVRLFATPQTAAYQAPLSVGFSRQQYWSGLPFPSPVDLPDPGIEPRSPALQTDAFPFEPPGKEIQKRGAMCIYVADSLCYTAKTNTTL